MEMENNNVELKRYCLLCNKVLVPIGSKRANGKATHTDWECRKYHKKCFKELGYKLAYETLFPKGII